MDAKWRFHQAIVPLSRWRYQKLLNSDYSMSGSSSWQVGWARPWGHWHSRTGPHDPDCERTRRRTRLALTQPTRGGLGGLSLEVTWVVQVRVQRSAAAAAQNAAAEHHGLAAGGQLSHGHNVPRPSEPTMPGHSLRLSASEWPGSRHWHARRAACAHGMSSISTTTQKIIHKPSWFVHNLFRCGNHPSILPLQVSTSWSTFQVAGGESLELRNLDSWNVSCQCNTTNLWLSCEMCRVVT